MVSLAAENGKLNSKSPSKEACSEVGFLRSGCYGLHAVLGFGSLHVAPGSLSPKP